ncbi:MAG: helix-turn-helix domain-containing protein [bacterium]|nr:helix-turn-helix domain-containing protein [bacterium]
MSYEELDRVGVIERVIEKRLTQREAARMLGLTSRQVRRLRRAYEPDGPRALALKHRGRPTATSLDQLKNLYAAVIVGKLRESQKPRSFKRVLKGVYVQSIQQFDVPRVP